MSDHDSGAVTGLQYIINPNGGECKGCAVGGSCDGSTMIPILNASVWELPHENATVADQVYRLVSCPPGPMRVTTVNGRFDPEIQECRPCISGTEYIIEPNGGTCQVGYLSMRPMLRHARD